MPSAEPYPPLQFLFVAAPKILFIKDIGKLYCFPLATPFTVPHCRLCEQWGKGHDTQFVTFPIAFTKQAFCCIVTPIGGGQGSDRVYSLSVKSFQILCGTNNDGLWLALGI